MYVVDFINFDIFTIFFFSWKLECWISCLFTCSLPPISAEKSPFLCTPGYRKWGEFSQLWIAGQWLRGTLVRKVSSTWHACTPGLPLHSWAVHPQPFTCSDKVCQTQCIYALTCMLFFSHLLCSLGCFPCDFTQ